LVQVEQLEVRLPVNSLKKGRPYFRLGGRLPSVERVVKEILTFHGKSNGLAMQPMNQMTERADRERSLGIEQTFGKALKELIANPNWQALFTFRLGYPTIEALSSPRRSVQEVVVSHI
jgi:hypothetical protein